MIYSKFFGHVRDRSFKNITLGRCSLLALIFTLFMYVNIWFKEEYMNDYTARSCMTTKIRNFQNKDAEKNTCLEDTEILKFGKLPTYVIKKWPSVYESRRRSLREKCQVWLTRKKLNVNQTMILPPPLEYYKNLVAEPINFGLLYCIVYKVASTNWLKMLMVLSEFNSKCANRTQEMINRDEGDSSKDASQNLADSISMIEAHNGGNLRLSSHYVKGWSKECVGRLAERFITFFFTRHPFERVVSAYLDKFTPAASGMNYYYQKQIGSMIANKFRRNASIISRFLGNDISFPEFIDYLLYENKERNGNFDLLYRPITQMCHPCVTPYHFIGRYETFQSDTKYILKEASTRRSKTSFNTKDRSEEGIGDENILTFPTLRHDTLERRTRTDRLKTLEYFNTLNRTQILKLVDIYKDDFYLFDYSYLDYLQPL
ncbi:unnamed protein product [Gordionus sp. m RMFG-2023]|uniref:carbohydrate sulfotransferase 11-like n=1 Tax=Gordionus sp. m RMFG-2023 TaxID=3053472 RepID=UPI0030DEB691